MNPSIETPPSMHLPEPLQANPETAPEIAGSVPAVGPERASGSSQAAPAFSIPSDANSVSVLLAASSTAPTVPQSDITAADDDLIEKEWVVKAKQIIASTRNDPREQNRQLSAFKADYIQKRYGKTIKLSE